MKVIITDCQPEDYGADYRPALSPEFSYDEVMELTPEEFIRVIKELSQQPQPKAVLGAPFIEYYSFKDTFILRVYNYDVE